MRRSVKRQPEQQRARKLDAVAQAMSGFRPANEVLSLVRSVPTRLVQFDHAIQTGGWPIEVISVCSGGSNEGKTSLALLLEGSFLDLDHFVLHIDSERTTPIDWARTLIGPKADDPVRYKAIRPDTYEDAVDQTRSFLTTVKRLRDDGHVPRDTTAIVVVDSLRKLTPKGFFKAATKTDEADPMKGRGPMIKAKWNSAWFDELTHLVDSTEAGFFTIVREYEDQNAKEWARSSGQAVKLGGGMSVVFEASVLVRVSRAAWVTDREDKDDEDGPGEVLGERHRITIRKTKVGGKEGRVSLAYFHTSNGTLVPAGHDRARDVLDLAKRFGVVAVAGSWLKWGKRSIGQGMNRSVVELTENASMLAELEAELRSSFKKNEATVVNVETGEVE